MTLVLQKVEYPLTVMDRIMSWNVKGANLLSKQMKIRQVISANNCVLVRLLETKVKSHNMGKFYLKVF